MGLIPLLFLIVKILNLYAGIGGNRKLWEDVDVTAVELNPGIAKIYQDFFPKDEVIVADAHEYLLENFKEYDFIWSSPPCPTHSRFNHLSISQCKKILYPDMKLYEEIILLKTFFNGQYCVENVITYYDPLITPIKSNSHYYWTNFYFAKKENTIRHIRGQDVMNKKLDKKFNIDISNYNLKQKFRQKILNNCVDPEDGLHILNAARGIKTHLDQRELF